MKTVLTTLFLSVACLLPCRASAAAEHNLAIVNTEIVFKGYWRTAVEDKRLKNAMEDMQKRVTMRIKARRIGWLN